MMQMRRYVVGERNGGVGGVAAFPNLYLQTNQNPILLLSILSNTSRKVDFFDSSR